MHRPCDNRLMSQTELTAMPWEAIFEVSKSDGFAERLTEGSGGSHLSAGIATNSVLMDIVGGSSNEATAPLLPAGAFSADYSWPQAFYSGTSV